MYKVCDVVLIPSIEQTKIAKRNNVVMEQYSSYKTGDLRLHTPDEAYDKSPFWTFHEILVLSSDKINEGDWVYEDNESQQFIYPIVKHPKGLCFLRFRNTPVYIDDAFHSAKKIIATSKTLYYSLNHHSNKNPSLVRLHNHIPFVTDDFIAEYCYSDGVKKIQVEYKESHSKSGDWESEWPVVDTNTQSIKIKLLKERYSKDELIEKIWQYRAFSLSNNSDSNEAKKWIEENI